MTKEELMKKSKEELIDMVIALNIQKEELIRNVNKMTPQTSHIQEINFFQKIVNTLTFTQQDMAEAINKLSDKISD